MNKQEIKQFIKENLIIEAKLESEFNFSSDMVVSLRFKDDEKSFTETIIKIPNKN